MGTLQIILWSAHHVDLVGWYLKYVQPRQNAANLAGVIFKCIFMIEKFCISIRISLKYVLRGPIDNRPALVQVLAWHRTGDKPLPEPTLTQFTDAYMQH